MKGFLEGLVFRPQGGPMAYPYTLGAKISQFPYRQVWHECWHVRYLAGAYFFIVLPLYYTLDKQLTSPANKALWKAKRQHDREHRQHELEKMWEVRT